MTDERLHDLTIRCAELLVAEGVEGHDVITVALNLACAISKLGECGGSLQIDYDNDAMAAVACVIAMGPESPEPQRNAYAELVDLRQRITRASMEVRGETP